jgi:hypothetical protein
MGTQRTLYASAARTATPTAVTFNMRNDSMLRVVLDATAITATPSVVVTVDVFDSASAKWVTVLTSAAITTVSTNALTAVTGLVGMVRVTVTHADADSITYSVGAHLSR